MTDTTQGSVKSIENILEDWSKIKKRLLEEKNSGEILYGLHSYFISSNDKRSRGSSLLQELFEELYNITKLYNNQHDGGTALFNFLGSKTGVYLISLIELLAVEADNKVRKEWLVELTQAINSLLALPSIYVSSAESNPSRSKLNKAKEDLQQLPQQFAAYTLQSLDKLFIEHLSPLPQNFGFINDSLAGKSAATSSVTANLFADDNSIQLVGCLSYHLLSILFNLCTNSVRAAEEIIASEDILDNLTAILTVKPQLVDFGLFFVQQQLTRTLARVIVTLCHEFNKYSSAFQKGGVISKLISTLRNSAQLPSVICVELAQVIVHTIKIVSPSSDKLVAEFVKADGYSTFADNLLVVGNSTTKELQERYVGILCHLLFVGKKSSESLLDILARNISALNIFLCVFTETKSDRMKSILVRVIFETVTLIGERYDLCKDLEPFQAVFMQFDQLTAQDQKQVLSTMLAVLSKNTLFPPELRAFVQLLTSKKSGTPATVLDNLATLLTQKKLRRSELNQAGLLDTLIEFIAGSAGEADLLRKALKVLRLMLVNHSKNQLYFAMRGGVAKLQNYLSDSNFRRDVLQVIGIIAMGEVTSQSKIIFDLIQVLQSSGGTAAIDTETLTKRIDILSILSYIFANNPSIREAFRLGGGFVWIIAVLGGLSRSIDEVSNRDEIYSFVLLLIEVLVNTMRGNSINQAYMRDEIGYQTILDALSALRIAEQGQYQVPLISALLSLSVVGGWPGNCGGHQSTFNKDSDTLTIIHLHHWARDFATLKNFVKTSLATTKDRSNLCSKCKDELIIDTPELLEMVFNLLIKKDTGTASNAEGDDGTAIGREMLQLDDNYGDIESIEESNLGLYLIVQALRMLTDLHLSNRVVLAKHGFVGFFLSNFKTMFIAHPTTREEARFQHMLLELLKDMAQFHITPEELKKCFCLLREDPPVAFLDAMSLIFKRGNVPCHVSHFPRRKPVVIKSPLIEEKNWPPLQGFSTAFWFQVIKQGETFGEQKQITLMTLSSKTKAGKFEVLYYKGLITVKSAGSHSITFTDFVFKENRWYHLMLVHTSKEQIKMYVDGILYKQTTLAYPSAHHLTFSCAFGSQESAPTVSWSLGNFYLFDMSLDDTEVFLTYCLGPNYIGALQQTQMSWFQIYDIIVARNLTFHKSRLQLVTNLGKYSVTPIKEKIVLLYSAKNMMFAGPDVKIRSSKVLTPQKLPLSPSVRAATALDLNSFVEYSPIIIGEIMRIVQMSAKECLQSIGGVSLIIYLFARCKTKEHQLAALKLLKLSLEWNPTNVREMSLMGGYEIISKLVRKRYPIPDEDLLEALFAFCGLRRSSKDDTFSSGVIQDLNALHNFILDWNLWKKSAVQVQALLFLSLSRAVTTHELAPIHAHRLRKADVVPTVLRILEEDQLTGVPARYAVELLGPLAPPSPFDNAPNSTEQSLVPLNQLFSFLLASHSSETSQAPLSCPYEAVHRGAAPTTRVTGTTPPTLKSLRNADGTDETPPKQIQEKRDLILNLLLETLKKCPSEVVVTFFEQTMTIEVLFALMQTRDESTLVLLLRVLEVILRDPKNVARFKRTYGFDLLGYHLRSYAVSTEVFGVLFSIAIGKSDTFSGLSVSSLQSFLHFTNQKQGQEELKLEHPEALSSILIAATSCHITLTVQHYVIKIIHDLFLQNEAIKGQMINCGIIELLCNLLVSSFEHKQALYLKGASVEEMDPHWEIETDVLGFLHAIALHGFMSRYGQVLTEEILVALHVLPFPFDYSVSLQRRVLYDVLEFFNKNQSPDQKLTAQTEKLMELAVTFMLFLSTKTAQQEKVRRSKLYRFKPRVSVSSTDKSLTQSVDRSLTLSDPMKYMKRESSLKLLPTSPMSRRDQSEQSNSDHVTVPRRQAETSGEFSLNKTLPADFTESEDEDSMSEIVQASKYLNIPVTIATKSTTPTTPRKKNSGSDSAPSTPRKGSEHNEALQASPGTPSNTNIKPRPRTDGFSISTPEPGSGYESAPMSPATAARSQADLEEFLDTARILTKEPEFVRLLFSMFSTHLKQKKSGSLLRKLYSKAISSSDKDLSWFFERFLIHVLTSYKNPQTLKLALEHIPTLNIDVFNSDRDVYCRILLYSSPLLSREGVQEECWTMWKTLAKRKIISELLVIPEDTPVDTLGPGDESELILMTEVVNTVSKLEKRDVSLVKEVTQVLIDFVQKARSVVRSRADFLRQISSTFSNKFITAQHALTKPLMDFIKELMERSKRTRQQWKKLLKRVHPDRSPWAVHPSLIRWELDPTEGPLRMRLRLRKVWANHHPILGATYTHSDNSSSSLIPSAPSSGHLGSGDLDDAPKIDPTNLYLEYNIDQKLIDDLNAIEGMCDDNEDFEMDSNFLEHELQPGDQIITTFKCSSITPFHKRDGEILIGSFNAYFIDSHRFQTSAERRRKITSVRKHLIFPYDEIEAIHKRRYLLKNSALEIFLINGRTYLMAFEKEAERDAVYDSLVKMEMVNFVDYENSAEALKAELTKRWQRGRVTNFEYLMHLNTLAGRSFNDLTQYPIFPFILSRYKKTRELNVTDPNNYRNLSKPMGAQTEERLQKFIEKYKALVEMGEPPFLYGSHYSNIGTVLHFLVRLEPFSRYFVEFQGGKFDVPDRVFHSLETTWELSSAGSTSDVKELVPEFFYLPEFLKNANGFKLGVKQDGQVVNNVLLPYWARGDPREFIERHREALESRFVSENLHNWIDLMFGFKQTGEAALKALNVFHPLTYEGAVDIDKITDPVMRAATITQISNYGQVPKQIFKKPHPPRGLVPTVNETIYSNYDKLSPHPLYSLSGQVGLVEHVRGSPVALGINKCILYPYGELCLQWGNWDGSLRITSLKEKGRVVDQIESFEMFNDTITTVDVSRNGWLIAAGFESSVVRLWRNRPYSIKYRQLRGEDVSAKATRGKSDNITLIAELNGHDGAVTCLKVSSDWSLVLSGSRDGTVIVWDGNHARYIRQLRPLHAEESDAAPASEAPMSIDELSLINTLAAHDSSAENSSAEVSTESAASPRDVPKNIRKRPTGPPEPNLVNLGVTAVNIHPYTGEIVTVLETTKGSLIDLWSINGDRLASQLCGDQVLCTTFTTAKPGLGVNLLITGHMSGDVKLWSMRDLTLVKSLTRNATPVTAISVSPDDNQIVSGDSSGMLVVYLAKPLDRPQLGLEVGL